MSDFICQKCNCAIERLCTNPDPCIGYLPGVTNACCGHGNDKDAYIVFGLFLTKTKKDASVHIRGKRALKIMQAMRQALGKRNDKKWHKAFEEASHDSTRQG
jgi:hypothetical protein